MIGVLHGERRRLRRRDLLWWWVPLLLGMMLLLGQQHRLRRDLQLLGAGCEGPRRGGCGGQDGLGELPGLLAGDDHGALLLRVVADRRRLLLLPFVPSSP